MGCISIDCRFNFVFDSIYQKKEPIIDKPMDFIPEVEDEFIRYAVSHKLDIPLFNTSRKGYKDSTQTKTPNSLFR